MNAHSFPRVDAPSATGATPIALAPATVNDKRERILDAAVQVFALRGFFQSRVSDIAKEAVPAEIFGYRATEEVVESDIGLLILHLDQALWAPVKPPATMRRIDVYRGGP